MQALRRMALIAGATLAAAGSLPASAGSVIKGDREWLQPADFLNYSWDEVQAVCPGGPCSGSLPDSTVDLTGFTWASLQDLAELYATYEGLEAFAEDPFDFISGTDSTWADAIFSEFVPTFADGEGFVQLQGYTREQQTGPAVGGGIVSRFDEVEFFADGATIFLEVEILKSEPLSFAGPWFWRSTVVEPPPITLGPPRVVPRGGREWTQPADFTGYTWFEVAELCPGGQCSGALPASPFDLTGFTWAAPADVRVLLETYIDSPDFAPPATMFAERASSWGPALVDDFDCSVCQGDRGSILGMLTAQLSGNTTATAAEVRDRAQNEVDTVNLGLAQPLDEPLADAGPLFWRPGAPDAPPLPAVGSGAAVTCRTDGPPIVEQGNEPAACMTPGGEVRAAATLDDATVRVLSSARGPLTEDDIVPAGNNEATASLVDLVTIIDGFDEAGQASGTLEVDVDGFIDDAAGRSGRVNFLAVAWSPDEPAPECIDDALECGLREQGYDFAQFSLEILDGQVVVDRVVGQSGGTVTLHSIAPDDVRAALSVPWKVSMDAPSFRVGIFGSASVPRQDGGTVDFFNTAKGSFTGPSGFAYGSKAGLASTGEAAEPPDGPVTLSGRVENNGGTQLCAMVLASGRFQFSCKPEAGPYRLPDLPRENDGSVTRPVYASGFVPRVEAIQGTTAEPVVLEGSGRCPEYNEPSMPAARPESAGQRHSISGNVFVQDTDQPVRALVLVNGQFVFSGDQGEFELEFPLDSNGQFTRQVYASGFAPSVQTFDASYDGGAVRLARSTECN